MKKLVKKISKVNARCINWLPGHEHHLGYKKADLVVQRQTESMLPDKTCFCQLSTDHKCMGKGFKVWNSNVDTNGFEKSYMAGGPIF